MAEELVNWDNYQIKIPTEPKAAPSPGQPATDKRKEAAAPADARRPVAIERPFDIGKPLGTPHQVTQACPKCGSREYRAVKAAAMIAFTDDRVCKQCSTRYTPPTPLWARAVFAILGLGIAAAGMCLGYDLSSGKAILYGLGMVLIGGGCLYKAFTR